MQIALIGCGAIGTALLELVKDDAGLQVAAIVVPGEGADAARAVAQRHAEAMAQRAAEAAADLAARKAAANEAATSHPDYIDPAAALLRAEWAAVAQKVQA